ncbi:MAG: hypothetical protein QOE52_3611 [Mycobacterium sp.]|jgi:uncharacterized ion transporter superfamily protein YfcC|nr:hypothetical protein [Mycobacterium sp.]
MMICVYVDGVPAPLTAYLQVVAESLLDVVHSLICACAGIGSLKAPIMARRADPVGTARRCA